MYERPRHNHIALILQNLNQQLLKDHDCYFGGGTAIAMKYGEYRTSFDIDFLIENSAGYRELRQLAKTDGIYALFRPEFEKVSQAKAPLVDQYGIRSAIFFMDTQIKFEIVLEGRIKLEQPGIGDEIEGVATLTQTDLIAEKLLANSDRFADDAVFSRDLIDLAFMNIKQIKSTVGFQKAHEAYGQAVEKDLEKAILQLQQKPDWLDRCIEVLEIRAPRAVVLQKLARLQEQIQRS
jgi:hypothetical protein